MTTGYADPQVLVSTDWVDQHKTDGNVRLAEVDVPSSFAACAQGIFNAVGM